MDKTSYAHPLTIVGKRSLDIVVALIGLILTLPMCLLIAVIIKIENPGPLFSKHMRMGYKKDNYCSLFILNKFRTFSHSKNIYALTAPDENRCLTHSGYFLKKFHLDRLPVLLNVLMGDMSIVGPVPDRPGESVTLDKKIPYYSERTYEVTPGIISLADVNMENQDSSEEARINIAFDHAYAVCLSSPWEWLKMDLFVIYKASCLFIRKHTKTYE